jgi:branched-chain amino acid transport system ATP-binding protein
MLLAVDNVSKRFGGLRALSDVSFAVGEGELVGLMGANGAGKTTLFSLIAGNSRPTSGAISFAGVRIDGQRPDVICRRGIARTFQIVRPMRNLSVLENVMVGVLYGARRIAAPREARARAREILAQVGLEGRVDSLASTLTLAGHKRLEIARALATGPRLLLLDEVIAGLNTTEALEAAGLISELRRRHGLTVLMIEHVMAALMRLAERLVVLHHGEVIAEGAPDRVTRDARVIAAYLGSQHGRRPSDLH